MKKIILGLVAVVAIVGGVIAMSAFEAHVVNVTAKIENALNVPITELGFGTVFPEEVLNKTLAVNLSESFKEAAGCNTTNLIQNGGFETPEVTDAAKWEIFPSGATGLFWTIGWEPGQSTTYGGQTRPDPALKELQEGVNGWLPAEGDQYAELDTDWFGPGNPLSGEPARVNIYQNITTTIGNTYKLTYKYSPRPGVGADNNTLIVRVNDSQVATHSAVGGSNTIWTEYTYEFKATGTTTKIEFAAGGASDSLGVFLDDVKLVECGRVNTVDYVVRQKPKCVDDTNLSIHPQVTHNTNGDFACPRGSTMMPLLCPYLSKSETTSDGEGKDNDGTPITAFHGPLTGWTMANTEANQVKGKLSAAIKDIADEWLIDLHVPCFKGMCAQDNVIPTDYQADPTLEHAVFGCDLWLEVTGIDQEQPAP
ncbi:MAG: DUF642 domain-containing protein [Candidatus Doudnabacteria bacterium]